MTPIIPAPTPSVRDILYGSRETTYRWEILTHQANGADTLAGYLDGVTGGSLSWTWNLSVKGKGDVKVADLAQAKPGMIRIADMNLVTARIRPVLVIAGLPEIPLGVYVISAAPQTWAGTGRTFTLQLLDRASVLDQDALDQTLTVDATKPVLSWVAQVITSAGETIHVDKTETRTVAKPMVWEAGTSKLQVVNDLLDVILYNGLQVSGDGAFTATPYQKPSDRPLKYDALNGLPRELIDGKTAIYSPDWGRDLDSYKVPNKVIAVSNSGSDTPPLTGQATNQDPTSPYSYQARGRWIVSTLSGVDVPDGTDTVKTAALVAKARQSLIASSSPQASLDVKHLPIPLRVGDVIRFVNTPAVIDGLYVLTKLTLDCTPTGLMSSTLQEVLSL